MRGRSGNLNLNIAQNRQVSVLLKLYNAVTFIFYGEHTILPKVAFENVWKPVAMQYDKRCRYKVFCSIPDLPLHTVFSITTLKLKDG